MTNFVTGYSEYALDAFELYASAFLTKPITSKKLREALEHLRYSIGPAGGSLTNAAAIGANLDCCREKAGLSRKELAASTGVAVQTVYRWENGERLPDIITLSRLAGVLGVDVETLIKQSYTIL